jgi:hypothetical protein
MSVSTRKIVAVLSASALLGGAGITVADAAKSSPSTGAARSARPGDRHRGPIPSAALAKIADALGVSAADLRAALEANRPARPADGPGARRFAADLAMALGVDASAVKAILEANRPARPASPPPPGSAPGRPDRSGLIAALASGLKLDTATVTAALDKLGAAHRDDHQARETAMFAALAKSLGKTADEVRAAFEANRPAGPCPRG